ncbi:hypothetical protein G3U99_24390 [Vibrio coralliilyticus OCN008]|uniref:hypothetical protein n=1 Tax=Vibrio coralliilyticus TaxID=190893 RepID=UPI0003913661|nr:hypothetical protein [Vibrio coralliilyticus]ERB66547.1 hypothetical protein N779_04010 [Vibrio coralliilyticus OCN008]QIJ87365.1 hypothetical protein G3U99_24390 [Vibrio coralliilyticus OCN008]
MTTSQDQEQQKELETRSAEETTAFLDEIENEFDPEVALEKEQQDKAQKQNEIDAKQMALEATQEGVLVGMGIVDTMVKEFVDPRMEIDEGNAMAISQAAAPVILKYNVSPPPWAVKYKEEIALGVAVLGLSASLFMQHRQLKKLDLEAKRAELERAQQEQSDATQH